MARGDHLYYFRACGTYSHHGIDCGDGHVIHYDSSPLRKLAGAVTGAEPPAVRRTTWQEFAQGHEVLVRPYDASQVDDADTVIERAESRLGEACYDVFGNNCEHFVVWCKTDLAESSQVRAHRRAADAVIRGAPVGAFLLRMARRCPGPYRGIATLGAVAMAGAVYVGTYFQQRAENMDAGLS